MDIYDELIFIPDKNTFPQNITLGKWQINFEILEKNKDNLHALFLIERGVSQEDMTVEGYKEVIRKSRYTESQQQEMVREFNKKLDDKVNHELFRDIWDDRLYGDITGAKVYASAHDYVDSLDYHFDRAYLSDRYAQSLYKEEKAQHIYIKSNNKTYEMIYSICFFNLDNGCVSNLDYMTEPMLISHSGDCEYAPGTKDIDRIHGLINGFDIKTCCNIYLKKYDYPINTMTVQNALSRLKGLDTNQFSIDYDLVLRDTSTLIDAALEYMKDCRYDKASDYGKIIEKVLDYKNIINETDEQRLYKALLLFYSYNIYTNDYDLQSSTLIKSVSLWFDETFFSSITGDGYFAKGWHLLVTTIQIGFFFEQNNFQQENLVTDLMNNLHKAEEYLSYQLSDSVLAIFQGVIVVATCYIGIAYTMKGMFTESIPYFERAYHLIDLIFNVNIQSNDLLQLQSMKNIKMYFTSFYLIAKRNLAISLTETRQYQEACVILEDLSNWLQFDNNVMDKHSLLSAKSQIDGYMAYVMIAFSQFPEAEKYIEQSAEIAARVWKSNDNVVYFIRYLTSLQQAVDIYSQSGNGKKMRAYAELGAKQCENTKKYFESPTVSQMYQTFNYVIKNTNRNGKNKFRLF